MRWMLFVLLGLVLVGCRYRDPSIDLLEGELRWMEDQLYMMESELEGACRELGRCQDDKQQCAERNRRLRTEGESHENVGPSGTKRPRIVMPFQSDSEDSAQPNVELPGGAVVELPAGPEVVLPEETIIESAPPQSATNEWEVIPSVPEGPVPPRPEDLGDPFLDDRQRCRHRIS